MNRLIPIIFIIAALIAAIGCSSEPSQPVERPGNSGSVATEPEPDYSSAVTNRHIRFESDTLTLDFEDGGILYISESDDHRFIDLNTGVNVVFNPEAKSLHINGRTINVAECRLIEERDGLQWYAITPNVAILVVEKH